LTLCSCLTFGVGLLAVARVKSPRHWQRWEEKVARRKLSPSFAQSAVLLAKNAALVGTAWLMLVSVTRAEDQTVGTAPSAETQQGGDVAAIVVNAADGPTLATRDVLRDAQEGGIAAIILKLENTALIQDEALMQLIAEELYAIAKEYGYDKSRVSLIECPAACD
jgi:hypothetical protein